MATITVRNAVAIALTTLGIGSGCTWFAMRTVADRELLGLSLAHQLEVSGLCANGLKLQAAQRGDTLIMLLEQRLDSGVAYSTELLDEGAHLDSGTPNLRDSVRRVSDYYASKGYTDKQQSAETLLARLQSEP